MKKALVSLLLLVSLVGSEVFLIEASQDSYVQSRWNSYTDEWFHIDENYGDQEELFMTWQRMAPWTWTAHIYVGFDLSPLTNYTINDIKYQVDILQYGMSGRGHYHYAILEPWYEMEITYSNDPQISPSPIGQLLPWQQEIFYCDRISEYVNNGYFFGICTKWYWDHSSETWASSETSNPPTLIIDAELQEPKCLSVNDNDTEDLTVTETSWGAIKVGNR